ncbi:MAG: M23 family metallopeptidase [Bacteroidales bacterium]|jgi:murein DD-endopeptidase MepM/ murein hydrolase activator NlpD|nr:M23 family metallopeptidase [Bacteroidales bacterium]
MRKGKYILDYSDLQYKRVKKHWKEHLLHGFMWFGGSVALAFLYWLVFQHFFGSPRERMLKQQIEDVKLQYTLLGRQLDNSLAVLEELRLSDEERYRTVLGMDTVSESFRMAGFGGVDRYRELAGFGNSDLMTSCRSKLDRIINLATVQQESFKSVEERSSEWRRELDHLPVISPVDVKYALGDGFRFRKVHPVLGTSRMHPGQDFPVPPGTRVYATGAGKVITSGWISGYGNCVVVDHGYGLQTIYGHLSRMNVVVGQNVKRGEFIALSGNTGISTGPHLHYQIEKYGKHMNPINFFNNDLDVEEYNEMIQAFSSDTNFR